MNIIETGIDQLILIEPKVFEDVRGYFFEAYNAQSWPTTILDTLFVQDNEAFSKKGVLRGLHYQVPPFAQAKLVRVIYGEVLDVAVDIRPDSATYGQSFGAILSGENKKQLYVPRGFAHGYVVLSDEAIFSYKCDNYYSKSHEGGIRFDDSQLNVDWRLDSHLLELSVKDQILPAFGSHRLFE